MDQRGRRTRWLAAAPVAVLAALVLGLGAVLARNGAILVQQCVPAEGTAGWWGLRLAVLRTDTACPVGELALGGDGRQVMAVVVMVALPVLLGELAGLALTLGLMARLHRLLRAAGSVLTVIPLLPGHAGTTHPLVRLAAAARTVVLLVTRSGSEPPRRRGPPTLQLA